MMMTIPMTNKDNKTKIKVRKAVKMSTAMDSNNNNKIIRSQDSILETFMTILTIFLKKKDRLS